MKTWQIVRIFAGSMVLLSLLLGMPGSPLYAGSAWLWLAAFAGANLLQSGFTGWCLLERMLRKAGLPVGS
jgi:hypothetical protein